MNEGILSSPVVSFFLATSVGLLLALLTWWLAKKSGLVPAQEQLIETLQDNTSALRDQVKILKEQIEKEQRARQDLAKKYQALNEKTDALEGVLAELLVENTQLRERLGMPPRTVAVQQEG